MKKYEYRVCVDSKTLSQVSLNEWGKLGWELCGMTLAEPKGQRDSWFSTKISKFYFFFKRELSNNT